MSEEVLTDAAPLESMTPGFDADLGVEFFLLLEPANCIGIVNVHGFPSELIA